MTTEEICERLEAKAASLDPKIANYLRDRQTNTRKRIEEDRHQRREGRKLEIVQQVMRTTAALHRIGEVPDEMAGWRHASDFITPVAAVLSTERHVAEYNRPEYRKYTATEELVYTILLDLQVFGETQADKLRRLTAAARISKIPGFFETPKPVITRMLASVGPIRDTDYVLEPSAGAGAITDEIVASCGEVNKPGRPKLICYEINSTLRSILELKPYTRADMIGIGNDFLECDTWEGFHKILLNPPFEHHADIDHVTHAWKMLKPEGTMCAVMSPSGFFRDDRKSEEFRTWFRGVGGETEDLPSGTFAMTGVASKLVHINK